MNTINQSLYRPTAQSAQERTKKKAELEQKATETWDAIRQHEKESMKSSLLLLAAPVTVLFGPYVALASISVAAVNQYLHLQEGNKLDSKYYDLLNKIQQQKENVK